MGTDAIELVEALPYPYSFKLHSSMCTELMKLVNRVSKIFPEIEAARPRCSSGIQSICLLNNSLEKAKLHLQYCCESSKLYLAITGDVIVSRCQRSRNSLKQSLGQIQTMVPVRLAAKISQIVDDLRVAMFMLDSSEEEAGKAMRELLQQASLGSVSMVNSEIKAIQFAASRLYIASRKAILIEKRSIKNQLDKVGASDPRKKNILNYLMLLLKKYGNLLIEEQTETPKAQHEGIFLAMNPSDSYVHRQSNEADSHRGHDHYEAQTDVLSRDIPPEEFKCPISMRVMYDPVVIASGQTFERMWIQKWFDEGNDTCPKTRVKLACHTLTPNTAMKDLISKWCTKYGITIPDPNMRASKLLDVSSNSIASLGSSMNDLHLPLDISNISLGSLDTSCSSDSSLSKVANGSNLILIQKNDDSYASMKQQDLSFLSGFAELPWDNQCQVFEEVKSKLQCNDQVCHSLSSENFVKPLFRFLTDAQEQQDVAAQRIGLQLLLAFIDKDRSGISYLHEDAFSLLSSLLDSEVTGEVLGVFEVLSSHAYCKSKIVASSALVSIQKILDSNSTKFDKQVIKILHDLSSNNDICSKIVSMKCIPKLVSLIKDDDLSRYSIVLLRNLCDIEEARVSVAETNGCIASISDLLESGSCEDQEHAVLILLSLCSQHLQYCQLVMDEGVIPSLVDISINGTDKGRASALELLRQLRDIEYENEQEDIVSDLNAETDANHQTREKKSSPKTTGFFRNLSFFSKCSSVASKKKRRH